MTNRSIPRSRIDALRRQIARLERARPGDDDRPVSSGCVPLDRLLPAGGVCRGALVEWLCDGIGSGAGTLALRAARAACREDGMLVVLDPDREFYPPAAARLGIEIARLIVVHAAGKADHLWALDQSLRCPGVDAVLARPDRPEGKLDGRTFRRLQLAAEGSGSLGLLIRPASVRADPSWAQLRLLVEPLPTASARSNVRRLRIHLLRCHGTTEGRRVDVEIDDETHDVHRIA